MLCARGHSTSRLARTPHACSTDHLNQLADVIASLQNVPLLAGCGPEVLAELASSAKPILVPSGSYLFHQGDPADGMAIVCTGRLEVWFETEFGEVLGGIAGVGATLGELASLTHTSRSASVRAMRDSELLIIERSVFEAVFAREPTLAISVARSLARRLQGSVDLAGPPAPTKVVTIVPLAPEIPVTRVARALAAVLGASGAEVATLDGPPQPSGPEPAVAFARLLDRCESTSRFTVLVAPEPEHDREWTRFCVRSADRVVLLARGGRPPSWALDDPTLAQRDLAFVGAPLSVHGIREHLERLKPTAQHHLGSGMRAPTDIARLARRLSGRAVGLVLSGGGARGLAHIGVIERLLDAGIDIDVVGGCSMGAFVSAMFGLEWETAQMLATCRRELVQRHPFNDYTLPRVSLIRARKARSMLTRTFGSTTLEELPRPTFTVSSDLETGELVVHARDSLAMAVGASMAIPGLVPPVAHEGRMLVDGGLLDNLPVDVMRGWNAGPIIAVDVLRRPDESSVNRAQPESRRAVVPSIVETMSRATFLGSQQRAVSNRMVADIMIEPAVADIRLFEFDRLDAAVAAGRRAADQALADGLQDLVNAPT